MNCLYCKQEFLVKPSHLDKKSYCSKKCMSLDYETRMLGRNNPNYKNAGQKICAHCHGSYMSYNKESKYCSDSCAKPSKIVRCKNQAYIGGRASSKARLNRSWGPGGSTKDGNHNHLVSILESLGVSVLDTSSVGSGFPDTICGYQGANHLVEIKNPLTAYGKRGLNPNQQKFAAHWNAPIYIIKTIDDVLFLVKQWRSHGA